MESLVDIGIKGESRASEAYTEEEFLIRVMYVYMEVSSPSWAMQAALKWGGSSLMFLAEAMLPTNWDRISPKCWEAYKWFRK